jgi:flagellar basal body P-ring formation protein FlgA
LLRLALLALALLAAAPAPAAEPPTARTIGADAIADAVVRGLAARQPLGDARFELDNPALRIRAAEDAPLAVERLTLEPRGGRVTAWVAAEGGEPVRVTGRLRQMVELPVLLRAVSPGETIAAQDVGRITVAADRFLQGYVADAGEVVGKTPRRALRPHEPLRAAELQVPIVVRRGELVALTLETPGLVLTAQGKAAEDGGLGATIRVANTKSGRVVEAVVTGPGAAAIVPPAAPAPIVPAPVVSLPAALR